ncbi:restriction endonuclease subunit S [Lacticaseibacillus paracasei]|uniref:restriction endonuclease subunit S n=1 Tax=Lacticaseibacillus paracasei TaxID=1597 RepID=UPI003BA2147E
MAPQFRFRKFTGDWEQRKLGAITESFSGGTPTAGKAEYYGGEIPFIRSGEISSDSTELFITDAGLNNSSAKMVGIGDILYALYGATSGETSISRINGAINQAILAIRPTQGDDPYMIVQWLKKQKETIISTYLQGGQGNLSGSIVKDLLITLPKNKDEQANVGSFFKQLDNLITLHQHKLAKLKELKKGYLQKLFPQNGEKVPEFRFKGYSDAAWEKRKLGEVADIVGGGTPSTSRPEYWNGEIDWYAPAEIGTQRYVYKSRRQITELGLEKSSAVMLPANKTILFTSRAGIGNAAILTSPATTNQGFQSMIVNSNTDTYFLYSKIPDIKHKAIRVAAGSTFLEISGKSLSKIPIKLPIFEEQVKIGRLFLKIDNLIAATQHKENLLKKIKQACLQNMFC